MNHYNVRFLEDALEDLEEIILYIASDSKTAALKMHDLIVDKSKDLANFPKRGRLVPDKKMSELGFRILIIERYLVFYKIDDDSVYIHRILHGSRNYPSLFEKSKDYYNKNDV